MTRTATIKIFGDADEGAVQQLERCIAAENGAAGVLCADNHLGYSQPIGGAVAYREHISPSGVGYDIGCGNKAVRTNILYEDLSAHLAPVMDEIFTRVSFGMGRKNKTPVDHPVLDDIRAAAFAPQRQLLDLAAGQLGTVGAGNHYVDLFRDELDVVWIGVHFGSRGFGHKTASGFLALAQGLRFDEHAKEGEMHSPPVVFEVASELGQAYIEAMRLAGEYAYAGRDVVVDTVLDILGAEILEEVHNHHNYAWHEQHAGEWWWVVRKGCTPAFPDQAGFVGATMAEEAVILAGVDSSASRDAFYSTVHGAGRALSRTKAAGKWRKRWINNVREDDTRYETEAEARAFAGATKAKRIRVREGGAIDFAAVQEELRDRVELRGANAEEAPAAYKRLDEVLAAHEGTIAIKHRLTPIGVAMAPGGTYDEYKD